MLVGPQQRAVGIVDQAVAVRPDDRHVAGSLDQLALQPLAVGIVVAGLAEAGGKADGRTSFDLVFDVRVGERACATVTTVYVNTDGNGTTVPLPDDTRSRLD